MRTEVTDKLPEEERIESNRYFADSPIYPGRFKEDWNRSYVLSRRVRRAARWCCCTA